MKRLTAESAFMMISLARKTLTPVQHIIDFTIGAIPTGKLIYRKLSTQNFSSRCAVLCQTEASGTVLQGDRFLRETVQS
jgi:hypothetical protein